MSKKYILLFTIIWFSLQPFENVNAALRTKARICAVKGSVETGSVTGDGLTCPLKQTMNQTECRVVNEATMIETGDDGWATVEYRDGRKVKIKPNTKVVLSRDIIYVEHGSSWYKVEKNSGGNLVIKTPTAIVGIRGTEFIVNVEKDGSTNIQLIEGTIEVSDAKKKSKMMLAAGMEVTIPKGSTTLNTDLLKINDKNKWWTDWPTLIPIADMPGYTGGGTTSNNEGNKLFPIADNHVYAYSYSNWNNANWGKYEQLGAGWNPIGGEKRAFLKFDLSGFDLNNFEKATLRLYYNHTGGGNRAELGVYPVHSPWTEGRGTYKPASAALAGELTWNNQPEIAQYPTVYFNPGQQTNKWIEVDVSTLVKAWLNGFPNHGLVIKAGENYVNGTESMYGFYSREAKDPDKRPHLVINGSTNSQSINAGNNDQKMSLPFNEDFSSGLGNWDVSNIKPELTNGQLFWNEGNHKSIYTKFPIPLENITIEFDGWTASNGIAIEWKNDENNGYNVSIGAYYNTAAYIGQINSGKMDWSIKKGTFVQTNKWQHYKIIKSGHTLTVYLDGEYIGEYNSYTKYDGEGLLKFSTYNSRLGIDNVKIYRSTSQNAMVQNTNNPLPIFEDFNSGLGNWNIGDANAAISNGQLFFHTGNSLLGVFNKSVPMENIQIEFDGYTETNGINVYLHNEKDEGYIVIMGGWFNAQSGSDVGKVGENRELVNGKVWEPKRWHHYKMIKCGNTLSTYCDGKKIYERNVTRKFNGKGKIKFSSWNTRIGIDNIKISKCSGTQSNSSIVNPTNVKIDGEWEMTCIGDIIFKFKLTLVQSGNGFYGDMVRTNGNEQLAKIEGQILPNDRIKFTRSIGNWKQYYTGEINQKSGSRATSFEGMFGFKDQLNNEWYAKYKSGLSSINMVTGKWLVDQNNGYNGTLNFQQDQTGRITGDAIWNGYLKGIIKGQVLGNSIEFTITYPNGDIGTYKGTLTQNGTRIINGTAKGNNGVSASWEANK